MDLHAAEKLAYELLHKHNLHTMRVRFSKSTTQAASCSRTRLSDSVPPEKRPGTIALSRHYFAAWDEEICRETILHEIAHALNPLTNSAHGPEWRAIALAIGSNGRRCVDPKDRVQFGADVHKWLYFCPNGHYRTRARRSDALRSCSKCSSKFDRRFILNFMQNTAANREYLEELADRKSRGFTDADQKKLSERVLQRIAKEQPVKVAAKIAKPATPSRAAEFDNGSAFINWD